MTGYRILGRLEVADGGADLPLTGGKGRALLARLLIDVNRTVSVDAIVDSLWGEEVPPSAIKMVHVYVSQSCARSCRMESCARGRPGTRSSTARRPSTS